MESQPENNAALATGQNWPDVAQTFSTRPLPRHEADVFDFERQSAQHWLTILGDRERIPLISLTSRLRLRDQISDKLSIVNIGALYNKIITLRHNYLIILFIV